MHLKHLSRRDKLIDRLKPHFSLQASRGDRAFSRANNLVPVSVPRGGTTASTIRILVPLTASDAILDEGIAILEKCLAA